MVKLTADLIAKQSPGHNKRRADESVEHYLSRLTHLPCQNRGIDSIDVIPPCRLLSVIYLYDNHLTRIENLNFAENLTHLYLQNNRLSKLENLHCCSKLEKLYLAGNQIQVLEGLDQCRHLAEIHLENQRLPNGEKLVFEPRTLQCLAGVLEILNIAGNNLDSLAELSGLEKLQNLTASNNNLTNLRELVQLLSIWPSLKRLDTSQNPLCSKARYRERLIVVSTALEVLDGKTITDNSRQFLLNWKASREAQQLREKSRMDLADNDMNLSNSGVSFIAPNIRSAVARARSVTLHSATDFRRSISKTGVHLVNKEPLAESTERLALTARRNKSSGFFASNSFHSTATADFRRRPTAMVRSPSGQRFVH